MIYKSEFRIGENNREILPINTDYFPYVCMYAELNHSTGRSWHWHSDFEITYIQEGEMDFQTPDSCIRLKKGEAIFVNSNVLHDVRATANDTLCKIYASLFDMHFLSGMYHSIFEQKYLLPVLKCRNLQTYVIRPDSLNHLKMLELLLEIVELNQKEPFGYEFSIRSALCQFWCLFLEETEHLRAEEVPQNNTDVERIKVMMQYIHEHYMEKITLKDIASVANIGERECTRCFSRCIKISPINYLNDYRVRIATKILLHSSHNIIETSEACGFSSASYFGKVFHEVMGCTPKEYRKKSISEV